MTIELVLKRNFKTDRDRVFAFVTQSEHLHEWWGPEGMHVPEGDLDLSRLGPWSSVMQNKEGGRFKVTGKVTKIDAPTSVEFTWAWHDENDARGEETMVRFDVTSAPDGSTDFVLTHSGFVSDEAMGNHEGGWTSSLRKLENSI